MAEINSICVYCGSQAGNDPIFIQLARETGRILAQSGIKLVYGGGNWGIMGAVSESALENGGLVHGIIPKFLLSYEGSHDENLENYQMTVTETMHERKKIMFEESDAFLTLPGGIGTLEEIVEIMTWAQLGQHNKPIGFLNINDFWKPMFELLDHMKTSGFFHASSKINPVIINDPKDILERMAR